MRIQNIVDGNARKIIARLHPNSVVKSPNVNEPHTAPTFTIDPIHEISELVNGSEFVNGVSSDNSLGSAGENQPDREH